MYFVGVENATTSGLPDVATNSSVVPFSDLTKLHRILGLSESLFGLVLSIMHQAVLIHLRFVRHMKSFELLMTLSAVSIVCMLVIASGSAFDLGLLPFSSVLIYYRTYVWLFLMNTLLAAYGYLVVMLCLDRCVALHKPMFYGHVYVRRRCRMAQIAAPFLVGAICATKWIGFHQLADDGLSYHEDHDHSRSAHYLVLKTIGSFVEYFVSGVLMIGLCAANVHKLRQLNKQHSDGLRICGPAQYAWQASHRTTAKICVLLTVIYCLTNWPYAITEWFYTDEWSQEESYVIASVAMNFLQALYLQINLILFALLSRVYRRTLLSIFRRCISTRGSLDVTVDQMSEVSSVDGYYLRKDESGEHLCRFSVGSTTS
uniref:G-protein coupled receptors family 1 profile domain-containing protein n=1 Tax=Plectus sambesii TaxID=2011161 RepID=A0A914WSP8_9BILA